MIDYKLRLERIRSNVMDKNSIKQLIIYGASNIYYLSGTDAASTAILTEGDLILVAPRLEYLRALEEANMGRVVAYFKGNVSFSEYEEVVNGDLYEAIANFIERDKSTGVVSPSQEFKRKIMEKTGIKAKDSSKEYELLRRQKDEEEVKLLTNAARIAEQALRLAVDMLEPGISEAEVASEIIKFFVERGYSFSFYPIVAFGEHAAHPHAKPSRRRLREGELVKIDLGAKYEGYCSDITRTFVYGKASSRQKRLYTAVLEAQKKALEYIKAGVKASKPYFTAYESLKKEGLDKYFNHGLGHGVGIDIHEPPYLSIQSKEQLLQHDVVTVEPGVYLAGYGGIRIEDMALVEEDGYRLITFFDKELEI